MKNRDLDRVLMVLFLFLFIGVVVFMSFLILFQEVSKRKLHLVEEPEFYVDSGTVSGVVMGGVDDAPAPELTAMWNITLLAKNPNTIVAIDYSDVQAILFYGSQLVFMDRYNNGIHVLARKQLPAFSLYPGNQTVLNFKMGVAAVSLFDEAGKDVSREKTHVGSMKLGLRLLVNLRYRTKPWVIGFYPDLNYKLFCDPVEFLFSPKTNDTGVFADQQRPYLCVEDKSLN